MKVMLVNPSKRKTKRKAKRKASPKRRAVARRSSTTPKRRKSARKKYRRNPIKLKGVMQRTLDRQIMPAVTQAGGAIGIDIVYGYLSQYLPVSFTDGPLKHVTKGLSAVVISTVAANFIKPSWANDAAKGALTVIIHDAAKDFLAASMPGLPLNYYSPAYVPQSLGMYDRTAVPSTYNDLSMYENSADLNMEY